MEDRAMGIENKRYIKGPRQSGEADVGYIFAIILFFAWLTHIFTCFSGNRWGFLIAGALFFPIGILHGVWIWFAG
jgi:hypothetical protein